MLLGGKKLAAEIKEELGKKIKEENLELQLIILQVGKNKASEVYIRNKIKFGEDIGVKVVFKEYPESVDEEVLIHDISELNKDPKCSGMILQLPVPQHLDGDRLIQIIDWKKDIDGLTYNSIGRAYYGDPGYYSATALGVMDLLDYYGVELEGKTVTVAGRSNLVGKVLGLLLINRGATVTVCNSKTPNIKEYIQKSDVFISAIGKPLYFTKEYFQNPNQIVIDVGTNFLDGKLVGDVDFKNIENDVVGVTPVPGGVGVLTVAELMKNLVNSDELTKGE